MKKENINEVTFIVLAYFHDVVRREVQPNELTEGGPRQVQQASRPH